MSCAVAVDFNCCELHTGILRDVPLFGASCLAWLIQSHPDHYQKRSSDSCFTNPGLLVSQCFGEGRRSK